MNEENQAVSARSDLYVFGDKEAGDDVNLPENEIRKMRINGHLEGAYAKIGHRTIIYHRTKLRQRVNEAFRPSEIND